MSVIIKCKRCNQVLFDEQSTSLYLNAHSDVVITEHNNENCTSLTDLLCISEVNLPEWILQSVQESNWCKGKINCSNCIARIGSFDFISGNKCSCKSFVLPPIEKAEQIFTDSKLDEAIDLKACIACLGFILTSTIKFNCDHNALHSELQQLGLPREHSTSIKRVTSENCLDIATKLKGSSLKINPLQNFMLHINEKSNLVHFNMSINDKSTTVVMTPYTSDILLENLKGIRESMKEMIDDPYNI